MKPRSWPQRGEWRRALTVSAILTASAFIQGICDVLATSGVGDRGVVYMWAVDAGIALLAIGALARGVDSVDRRRLGIGLLWTFALLYLGVWSQTLSSANPAFWWGVLGVVDTLQSNLVVLLAWALARDLFNEEEAIRLFGLLGGVSYVGTLGGTALAGWCAHQQWFQLPASAYLLPLCAGVAVVTSMLVAWLMPPHGQVHPPPAQEESSFSLHDLIDGQTLRALWQRPLLRWLSALQVGNSASWTMMSLAVLYGLRVAGSGDDDLQAAYAQTRIMGPVAHAFVQAAFSSWLLRRLGYGRLFLITPLVLLLNMLVLGAMPGLFAAWLASLMIQFAFGAEGAAGHALLVRTPAQMRGRVGTFVMGTLPQTGYLIGCALLFLTRAATDALGWTEARAMQVTVVVSVLVALATIAAGQQLRRAFAADAEVA